jgi:3,4-dihydroxy 2-butanone 4-phosphate synthase/GTP cyclohydrolase II
VFQCIVFSEPGALEHLALVFGDVDGAGDVLVRVHSECLTGEALGSRRCDCGAQLDEAMRRIAAAGRGVVVYMRGHEGRGIGLAMKIAAYALQDRGLDTVDANLALGLPADDRDYAAAAAILQALGVRSVRLLTNNPLKRQALEEHGVRLTGREAIEVDSHHDNLRYLTAKRDRMGHLLRSAS